jgi:Tol biopolymer transport system component
MVVMNPKRKITFVLIVLFTLSVGAVVGCVNGETASPVAKAVPEVGEWGIYELDLATLEVNLVYSTPNVIFSSALRLNSTGDKFVFAQTIVGTSDDDCEIFSVNVDGSNLCRITDNDFFDLYPAFSPDGDRIAFLSKRDRDLDIYLMDADGGNLHRLYDSGDNDADIDWAGDSIVFTSQFAVWRMNPDGTHVVRVTDPPGRGEWGEANLPRGDYDPRLTRDGTRIVYERLEDVTNPHGGYDFFTIGIDGTGETRLTDNGYSQGLGNWSHSGEKIVYVVGAIGDAGKYDIYIMNSDGTDNHNITPSYFPDDFLCYSPCFSGDDSRIFFIGQWWR